MTGKSKSRARTLLCHIIEEIIIGVLQQLTEEGIMVRKGNRVVQKNTNWED